MVIGKFLFYFFIPEYQNENSNFFSFLKKRTGFCQTELQNLKSLVQSFDYEKVRLVAISPQIPSLNRKMVEDNHLNFEIVYDQDLTCNNLLFIDFFFFFFFINFIISFYSFEIDN